MLGAARKKLKSGSCFNYLNDRNLSAFISDWCKNATFVYPGNISISDEHHGIDNIKRWWKMFFAQFPEAKFTYNNVFIKNCFSFGPSNEITLDWDVVTTTKEKNNSLILAFQLLNYPKEQSLILRTVS